MMLKKTFLSWLVFGLTLISVACSSKKEEQNDNHENQTVASEDWKEMDDFHMVMAESFHPYKDSSNLEPARNNAASLVEAADKWSQAPLPDKFKGDDEMKFKLNQLNVDASTFAELTKSGDDKSVGQSLTKLHDLFHEIQESWYEHDDE